MNKLRYALVLLTSIALFSCETDIDVNAPYEDITIVHGVVNPLNTNHYIKINKAFLGETSALDLAANADNFNYADGDIEVVVNEYNGSNFVQTHPITRTINEVPKDPGIFDNSSNVLYKFIEPNINRNNAYKLKITNKESGKEITSEALIVGNTVVSKPAQSGSNFNFWIGSTSTGAATDVSIKVTTGENVGRVVATLVFSYYDRWMVLGVEDSLFHTVRMPLGEELTTTVLGGESLEWTLEGGTFFDNIRAAVPLLPSNISHRELDNISLEFLISGTELSTFMTVSAPSTSVNQDKPAYTNIDNGLGVFSSRENMVWLSSKVPAAGFVNIQSSTITYLDVILDDLGFCFGTSATSSFKCPF